MKQLTLITLCSLIIACSPEMEQVGDLGFKRYADACDAATSLYWLMDIEARNERDSVFINTKELNRKAELRTDLVDMSNAFFQILKTVCEGDSIFMVLRADSFYSSLNVTVPSYVKPAERLKIMVTIHDRLDSNAYAAYKVAFERESMQRYVEKFQWNATFDSSTGIYYERLKTARSISNGFSSIKLKYLIKTIDDQLIAFSKDDDPLIYDAGDSTILKGIAFLAKLLNTGESLQAIIPSSMAYGAGGKDKVRPFMPVVVELECQERLP